jgi:dienelactone hydrolase
MMFLAETALQAQNSLYQGPLPRITSGFGADGPFSVQMQTIPSPQFSGQVVTLYFPQETAGAVVRRPVVFFAHGFGAVSPFFYEELLRHIATRGYVVVYSPYQALEGGLDFTVRYNTLWAGFEAAVRAFSARIDTTRVGMMGHSYGAGALPAMAWRAFVERSWGSNGRFLFPMAPWYSDQITNDQLRRFPPDTKLLMQIYNDDGTNDHHMAADIFTAISIPASEKNFVNVVADTVQTASGRYIFGAGHSLCATGAFGGSGGAFDGYDVYAVFRLVDALAEYAFTGSTAAKNVALGNGSPEQVFMGMVGSRPIKPLIVSNPPAVNPQQRASWLCSNPLNPRRDNCAVATSVHRYSGIAQSVQYTDAHSTALVLDIAPNPAVDVLRVQYRRSASMHAVRYQSQTTATIEVVDVLGRVVQTYHQLLAGAAIGASTYQSNDVESIILSVGALPEGVYGCRVLIGAGQGLGWFHKVR